MDSGTRGELLDRLAAAIEAAAPTGHPARIAVDGPDAAGKTTLADELAAVFRTRGRKVIRASIDGFHRPRAERYRRGEFSPQGCYHDTFDHEAHGPETLRCSDRPPRSNDDTETATSPPSSCTTPKPGRPTDHAEVIVHNDEPQHPSWEVRRRRP